MSNYSTYQDAIKTAEESAGTTAAKYEAYKDSIEAHLNKLTTAWETFTQRLGQNSVIKFIVDSAAFLVDHLDKIITRFLSFMTVLNAYKLPSMFKNMWTGAKNLFTGNQSGGGAKFGVVSRGFSSVEHKLDEIKAAIKNPNGTEGGDNSGIDIPKGKKSAKARWGAAALTGVVAGLSAGLSGTNSYFGGVMGSKDIKINDIQSNDADNIVNGVATGLSTGLLSAIPVVGPLLGPFFGPILGDALGGLFKWWNHRDEMERKQRVQDALKIVDAINKANEGVQKIDAQVAKRGSSDFDATETWNAIYSTLNALYEADNGFAVVEDFERRVGEALKQAGVGGEGDTAQNYLSLLVDGTDQQAEIVNRILSATLDLNKAFETYASQEETRYQNAQSVDEIRKAARELGLSGVGSTEDLLKELKDKYNKDYQSLSDKDRKTLADNITKLSKVINSYNEMAQEVNKKAFESAITMSGVSDWTSADMAVKSLDEAVIRIVNEVAESGAEVGIQLRSYNKKITKEARDAAISVIKNRGLGDLFKRETTPLFRLLEDKKERDRIANGLGKTFEEVLDDINKASDEDLKKLFKQEVLDKFEFKGTAEDLRDYILHLNDSTVELESFSKAVSISQNDLENHSGLFDVTLQELTRSVSETAEAMNQMTSIVDNIISTGGLSVTILQDILKKAPSLLYKTLESEDATIDTSIENIFNNIWNKVMGQQADVLLSNAQVKANLSDSNFIEAFKTSLKAAGKSDAEIAYLAGVTDLESKLDDIRERGDDQILNALLSSTFTDDIENTKKILSQLSTYQTKVIDNQINNLNSQKEAISKVNDEYKKEIDLIRARQALENAKNEKKRVYRAGVGWTYEADQEAIQKAQEDLQQKENQIDEENLQYQIDLLEKEKSILNNLPSEMTLQRQKELFEVFGNSLSAGGISVSNFVVAIQNAYNRLNNIKSPDMFDYTGSNTSVANAGTSFKDYTVPEGYKHSSDGKPIISGEKGSEEWKSNANDYNDFLDSLKNKEGNKEPGYFTKLDVEHWLNEDGTAKTADELNKRYGLTGENKLNDDTIAKWVGLYNTYKNIDKVEIPDWNLLSNGNYSLNGVYYNPNMMLLGGLLNNNKGMIPLEINPYGENRGKTLSLEQSETADTLIGLKQHFGSDLSDAALPVVMYNDVVYYKRNGKWRAVDFSWSYYERGKGNNSYDEYIEALLGNPNVTEDNRWGVTKKELEDYFLNLELPNFEDKLKNVQAHARGAYDFSGGPSLINELGTEGIVTPQGTITALPAHTGIVPADLTKNLYRLGELSPNLIKGLSTIKTEANRFNSTEDNSMHVNDLNITVNADSDFNFNKLLAEARQYMAITRHNNK